MEKLLLLVLTQILMSEDLQDKAAQHAAEFLANALPDVTEDAIGSFLEKVGDRLISANPDG